MRLILNVLLTLLLLPAAVWGGGAVWYRLPLGAAGRGAVAGLFVAAMLLAIVLLWRRRALLAGALIVPLWAVLLGWWGTILPSNDRDWQPEVAHVARAAIDGDVLTVENVRNFDWRSASDFDQRWETRRYNLNQLRGADLFLSYWAGENVAHAIVSFDFADSVPLAFSIEIRKEMGESYSSTTGFFKSYELAVIAADERDVVKVRSTVRGEDVRLFRLDMQPETVRGLLGQYVELANDVSATPRWYNTITANCTTMIFGMARRMDPRIRMDWRILLPGRLPAFLREHEFVSRDVPLEELVALGRIGPRAAGPPPDPGFSARIREGVPDPAAQEIRRGTETE
ncbi:DUF4105 domain-containing protein [Sandaracinobacter neustonicus]|uniref:DUF4105 domain-containing protein n=1 Tax=Sandaracinobacter neustonicus TaxID=1715348 RepID=A0A501XNU2_9SPHN|nr:DUF4105 domain-containing protein [Sandaracinobacter neustonicus]TPE62200.1 DUF4105 domain-containing protein [Sandaracinobacter neustonicus]